MNICEKCGEWHVSGEKKFCCKCGGRVVHIFTHCNYCLGTNLYKDAFCSGCGRSRKEALETYPPPLLTRIKDFFKKLFTKK